MEHRPDPDVPSAPPVRTRIVLLAGPSGSGQSSLAARVRLPTVCLDDFSKDGDDPTLPLADLPVGPADAARRLARRSADASGGDPARLAA